MQCLTELLQVLKFLWNLYDIYQQDISKVIVLKLSTQVVMSSAFRKVPCTYPYQQKFGRNSMFK